MKESEPLCAFTLVLEVAYSWSSCWWGWRKNNRHFLFGAEVTSGVLAGILGVLALRLLEQSAFPSYA